jgi:hypothetical protein
MSQDFLDAPLTRRIASECSGIVKSGEESFNLGELLHQLLSNVFAADLSDVALVVGGGLVIGGAGNP